MSSETTEQDPETPDLYSKVLAQEKEIIHLREKIAAASIRHSELLNEKYALERRFSELRVTLDEKQREIVNSASIELDRRKGDLDVNLNLLSDLKAVEHEKHIFTTSLLEILSEFFALPHATNASALTNAIKNLHDQLLSNINNNHAKLAELASRDGNNASMQAPSLRPTNTQFPRGSNGMRGFSPHRQNTETRDNAPENMLAEGSNQVKGLAQHIDMRHLEKNLSPLRNVSGYNGENMIETNGFPHEFDRRTGNQVANQPMVNDMGDDGYPWIENFQISGDAKPGCEISCAGYPRGGTSLCMFQWVRYNPDGTTEFIEGATYHTYAVTADDVDKLIAVECIPMDDNGRHGAIVRMFANDNRKISCNDEMQDEIDAHVSKGLARFDVLILLESSEDWEHATLALRRSGFMVKVGRNQEPLISEKYSRELSIKIPGGLSTQFVITCSNGISYPFQTNNGVRMRDTLVLTMRIFQSKALDGGRG